MRLHVVFIVGLAVTLLVSASCGGGDSSLEDIGDEVQATLVAESTIAAATLEALPTELRYPTDTPEPDPGFSKDIEENLDTLTQYGHQLAGFFTFFEVRIGEPGEVGALSDDEGNLPTGWMEDCCPRQLVSAHDTLADANALVDELEGLYLEDGAADHVALIPDVRTSLVDVRSYVDQVANAETYNSAILLIAAGDEAALSLNAAIDALGLCCETPTPTPSPAATP